MFATVDAMDRIGGNESDHDAAHDTGDDRVESTRCRTGCLVALLTLAVAAAALWSYRQRDYRPVFSRTAGELVAVRDSTGIGRAPDGKALTEVTLVSDTGLEVRLRVRAERDLSGERHPAALMVGGFRTGRRAVDAPRETADLVLASIEYPYEGPREDLTAWQWVRHFPAMRRAALETPPALLLAAQYLYAREDVDRGRVTMIGVSLGVPFAVASAATDRRLAGAALLFGGGDIDRLVSHAYAHVADPRVVKAMAVALDWVLAPLEPLDYAGEIAPRPLLMVNARGDEFIPDESVLALYRRARKPKRLVWIDTAHVRGSEEAVVERLLGTTLEWMEQRHLR